MKQTTQYSALGILRKLASSLKDNRGVSAIEFAIIFPVLITLYMGVAELTQGLTIDRKVTQISSSVADLVSQEKVMNSGELSDIYMAAEQIVLPYDKSPLIIIVSSVSIDASGNATVDWSNSSPSGYARASGSPVALPNGINEANAGVVMSEVRYDYTSNLGKFITGTIALEDQFFLRPRNSAKVTWQ